VKTVVDATVFISRYFSGISTYKTHDKTGTANLLQLKKYQFANKIPETY
jgi:hypothetical protein